MKRLIVILTVLIVFVSCKEKTTYRMDLLLENNTENNITVRLYPKNEYKHYDMYRISDIGGGYRLTEFSIKTKEKGEFYTSGNLNQKPYDLTSKVFDSIHIVLNNENTHIIKFSKDTVVGYSENIFNNNSNWNYEIINEIFPDQFDTNPTELHQFRFEVSVDKYK